MSRNNFAVTAIAVMSVFIVQAADAQTPPIAKASASSVNTVGKAVTKVSTGPLSSAKTIKELLESDDAIALMKERNAVANEIKRMEKEVPSTTSVIEQNELARKTDAKARQDALRAKKILDSTIILTGLMGIQGNRTVQASIAGKHVMLSENSDAITAGWKLISINGACADFLYVQDKKSRIAKKATSTMKNSKLKVVERTKTACFTRQELPTAPSQFALSGPGVAVPLPIPFSVPNTQQSPQGRATLITNAINPSPASAAY